MFAIESFAKYVAFRHWCWLVASGLASGVLMIAPVPACAMEMLDGGELSDAKPMNSSIGRLQNVATRPRGSPFEVTVNGSKGGTWVFLEHEGAFYAPLEALIQWRLEPSSTHPPLRFKKTEYHALAKIPGYAAKVDLAKQSIEIDFAPDAFGETRQGGAELRRATVGPSVPSLLFNYELNLQRASAANTDVQTGAGLWGEVAFSTSLGLLSTSFIGLQPSSSDGLSGSARFKRLDVTFTHDFPDSNRTLFLGDTSTRAGTLGNSVYFGGFRIGSDFSLTPGFSPQSLPIAKGVSSAPSTVDLYVNDILRQTTQVPSGPFSIENIPPTSGAGEIRMVVRDIFGRETLITRSFFSSSRLLARGLSDWSLEGGRVRHDLGTSTAYYGEVFARGYLRHGVTDNLTFEGVSEGTSTQKNFQLGVSLPVGHWLGSAALAASHTSDVPRGYRWLTSFEKSEARYGVSFQTIGATKDYRTLASTISTTRRQLSANFSFATGSLGSFGVGMTSMRTFDERRIDTRSVNYTLRFGARATFSFVASRSSGADFRGTAVGMTLAIPFDKGPTAIGAISQRSSNIDAHVSMTQNPSSDTAFGWRTLIGRQAGTNREEAGMSYWGKYLRLTTDASQDGAGTSVQRMSMAGGLVLAGGHVFAQRDSHGSLALVEVPGYANVRVGLNGRNDTRTSGDGTALVPNLMPYQENSITLNAQDLPISAELDSIEQIAVPERRNVVRVRFPVRSGQGALLRIVLEDGKAPPPGSTIRLRNETRTFFVARRGEAFVTGLQGSNELIVKHPGGECEVSAVVPSVSLHKIPRIGPLECRSVSR